MGWGLGWDSEWKRYIGYGVPAYCDHPKCRRVIDRGLSYVCGGEPFGGDDGCGLYFCEKHGGGYLCERCSDESAASKGEVKPFPPKPEHPRWLKHQATDPSWAEWRKEQKTKAKPSSGRTRKVFPKSE
jgi:hypothetical protein